MTTVIDERVVEMRFNNEDFERNVSESLSTLEKLKSSLNFDSAKSLEDLGRVSKGFSLSGITESVTEATSKFGILETVGLGALTKIGSKAAEVGMDLVKKLSIDQVAAGFDKYAEKTTAVQTIMAATGKSVKDVEVEMEKLNWYTDETSYNFADMANNIGKFTSNGVDLEKSASAMQGIANWAAVSGQNSQAAARAMYNLSQAIGSGAMTVKDWVSIENVNMSTREFRETAMETAAELGKLRKVADGLYETLDGKTQITYQTFRDSLKKKWFDTDVMVETLNKYNSYADELYNLTQKTGRSATQLMMDADKYAEGTLEIEKISKSTGVSVEELTKAYESLNSEANELSKKAFQAGQEAKTFKDVMDATADAVSTGWMNTFQLIFGNYEEAKALWTGLANAMVDVFTATGTARNEILGFWNELGGRESLIRGLVQMVNLVAKPLEAIGAAFKAVMPDSEAIGIALANLTNKFEALMDKLQPSQELLTGLYMIFKGLFTIIKSVFTVIGSLFKAFSPLGSIFGNIVNSIGVFITYVAAIISVISEYASELGIFETVSETLALVFEKISEYASKFAKIFGGGLLIGLQTFASVINGVFSTLYTKISTFEKQTGILQRFLSNIAAAFNFVRDAIMSLFTPVEKATTVVKKATVYYGEAAGATAEFGTLTRDAADDVQAVVTPIGVVMSVLKKFEQVVGGIGGVVALIFGGLAKTVTTFFSGFNKSVTKASADTSTLSKLTGGQFTSLEDTIRNVGSSIGEFFTKLKDDAGDVNTTFGRLVQGIKNFFTELDVGRIAAMALSVGLLMIVTASVRLASKVEKTTDTVLGLAETVKSTISGIGGAVKGTFNSITGLIEQFKKRSMVLETIKTFAIAFTMVAASLTVLSLVPTDKLLIVSGLMLGFVTVFSVLTAVVVGLSKKLNNAKFQVSFRSMAKSIILLASSMAILAAAVSILAGAKIEGGIAELWNKVGAAVVMLAGVVAAAIALSKFSKDLPKGAILLLAMAFAMNQLATAVVKFASIKVDNINDHWGTYLAMFGGLSLIMAAAGHVKVTSALALLALAKAMKVILPAMGEIVELAKNLPYERMAQAATDNMVGLAAFFGGLAISVMTIIKLIQTIKGKTDKLKGKGKGGVFSGIGGTIAGIGIGVALIVLSIKKLHELYSEFDEGEIKDIGLLLGGIVVVIGIVSGILTAVNNLTSKAGGGSNKAFAKMALMMVGLSISIRIMVSAVKALSTVDDMSKAWQAVGMIVALGALLAAVVGVAGTVQKAIPAMVTLIAATVAIGVLIGELAILSLIVDNPGINKALGILAGMFIALNVTMRSLEKIKDVKAGPIFGVLGIIAAMSIALIELAKLDVVNVGVAAASMAVTMLAVGSLFKTLSEVKPPSLKSIGLLLLTTLALAPIAAALYVLSQVCDNNNWQGVIAAATGMSLALLAVAAVTTILSKVGSGTGMLAAAASVVIMSTSLIAIAAALKILEDIPVGEAAGKVAALLGIVSGIILVFGILSAIPAIGQAFVLGMLAFSIAIIAVAGAFYIIAAALPVLANGLTLLTPALQMFLTIDFNLMSIAAESLILLAVGLGAVAFAGLAVGLGAFGIIAFTGALFLLGLAAPTAAEGLKTLEAVDLVGIANGLVAIGLAGAAVGILSPLLLLAAAAVGVFGASLLFLNASLQASAQMFDGFLRILDGFITSIKQKITDITNAFKKLLPDIGSALNDASGKGVINRAVTDLAKGIAGEKGTGEGLLGKISEKLGWASPPQFVLDLMNDIGTAFGMNSSAVSGAQSSGSQIGDAFGSSMATKVSGWLSNIGSGIGSFFNSGAVAVSSFGSELDSTGARAEKFGKAVDGSGKKVGLLERIQNKANDALQKGKDELGEIIGFDPADFLSDVTEKMEEATGGTGDLAEGLDGVSESAGKAGKSVKDLSDSLKDTLAGQLDMFSEFELKTEMSSEKLLSNMQSNIDGFASWSHRMTVISERFSQADPTGEALGNLYEKLMDMGPKGYETMNAIYQMTDDQLAQLRDLWATGMTLPEGQADIVMSGYKYLGEMATQGFSNALDDHKALHEARNGGKNLAEAGAEGVREYLIISSPSKLMEEYGRYTVEGLANGMDSVYGQGILYFAVKHVCEHIIELFNTNLSPEMMGDVGNNIVTNLFESFFGKDDPASNPLIGSFLAAFTDLSIVEETLTMFVEFIIQLFNTLFEMDDSESTSLLFYRYARSFIDSLSLGIQENLGYIHIAIILLGMNIKTWIDEEGIPDKAYEVGMNLSLGLAQGITDYAEAAIAAASSMMEQIIAIMEEIPDEQSPSKITRQIGRYISEGLAIGITDAAGNVYQAANEVSQAGLRGIEDNTTRIQDLLGGTIDLNPVITPMLDLSLLRQQVAELNSLMSGYTYGLDDAGQNGGNTPAQQINFTQNNYSPKALSRVEIYRQTKNQVSMMKGVIANA